MILLNERINAYLKGCFQKNLSIVVRDKKFATGKLILFKQDGCYLQLILNNGVENQTIEIPYPFNIYLKPNSQSIILDYKLEALSENDYNLLYILRSITKRRESRFYNTLAEIQVT